MFRRILPVVCVVVACALGCDGNEKGHHHHHHDHEGGHHAAHGGCLSALTTCENGHAEAKLDGGTLTVWFVGGGSDTEKAVRIPDAEITLAVTLDGAKEARALLLAAKPNELAEEKPGDCSRFEGKADWLAGAAAFTATGRVTFKGKPQDVRIEYPKGYDPD